MRIELRVFRHRLTMQSLWMIAASFLFASMGVCVKLAAETFPPSEIVFYRSFISFLMMLPVVRLHGVSLATPHWRFQLWRSAAGFVSLLLYFYAIFLLPLATAATLAATSLASCSSSPRVPSLRPSMLPSR